MTIILGIKIQDRCEKALEVQKILTEFGKFIKTRLGLNSQENQSCNACGIILLEITDEFVLKELELALCGIENIEMQKMIF